MRENKKKLKKREKKMPSILAWVLLPLTFSDMQLDTYEMPELKILQGFRDDHMP